MSAGITRIHGTAIPQTLTGGYQLAWYSIAGTGFDTNYATVNSNFEKAVRAIETVATVVILGTPGSAGFMVGIDAASFAGRGDSSGYGLTGVSDVDTLDAAITASTGISTTVTVKTITGTTFA